MTQPPQNPPPPSHQPSQPNQPSQPPMAWITVTLQGHVLLRNWIPPTVRLNGTPMPTSYGENVYPVPPGPWRVECEGNWWMKYGKASLDFQLAEGQNAPVFYKAPAFMWGKGKIGHQPQ